MLIANRTKEVLHHDEVWDDVCLERRVAVGSAEPDERRVEERDDLSPNVLRGRRS